jgi:hypothetical protein
MTTVDDRPTVTNPYVGPNPIEYGQPIYGRDLEIPDLRDTLISHRIVLFYAPSGAGKSSLLNAGLRPQLEERDFSVLPTIRVGNDVDAELGNRYILSTIQSLDEARPEGWSRPIEELAELGLDGYLAELAELDESGKDPCLVFDQFEELFTLDPTDQAAKREFFTELGRCLRNRSHWALITMREDYIAQLDPYLTLIPTRLATRFRLDRLGPDAAMAAAQRPALAQGVDFTEQAAKRLVDNIRSVRVRRGDQITTEFGPHVEPVVLQVVCHRLWERLNLAADDAITVDDIDELGDVDDALADFCDDQIARAAAASGATQLQIRDWIESELIGEQGFRTQALRGPGSEGDTVIRTLEDGHFLRSESRRGTNWYEIAHDRLVGPLTASNERWREANLTSIQQQADRWADRGRPDALLLRNEILDEAQVWADQHQAEVREVDTEYLDDSERARRRAATTRRRVAAVLGVLFAVAVVGWVWGADKFTDAKNSQATAESAKVDLSQATKDLATIAVGLEDEEADVTEIAGDAVRAAEQAAASDAFDAESDANRNAEAELQETRESDKEFVDELLDRWVPQLSANPSGGDSTTILEDHNALKAEYEESRGVVLIFSNDYQSFRSLDGWWVTVARAPFETYQEALDWCIESGRNRNNCFAKLVSKTEGPEGTSKYLP